MSVVQHLSMIECLQSGGGCPPQDVFSELFKQSGKLRRSALESSLLSSGLRVDDGRLAPVIEWLRGSDEPLSEADLASLRRTHELVDRVLYGRLVIPEFASFVRELENIYNDAKEDRGGIPVSYEDKERADMFGVAVTTIDGQNWSIGDAHVKFSIRHLARSISYAIAQSIHGSSYAHIYVGKEPSGRKFNEMCLDTRAKRIDLKTKQALMMKARTIVDEDRRDEEFARIERIPVRPALPHNPLLHAGAIVVTSLLYPELEDSARFERVIKIWGRLCGHCAASPSPVLPHPTFNNHVCLTLRAKSDRHHCLAYMIREEGAFPGGVDLHKTLELYFMFSSIEMTTNTLSVVAATLANGGVCPMTGDRIFEGDVVRNCLSQMFMNGQADRSGEFAFSMGFPCTSSGGGACIIVIPNVCGFCTWAPRLDLIDSRSLRGQRFCVGLTKRFCFHLFDVGAVCSSKMQPHRDDTETDEVDDLTQLLWAASEGDILRARQVLARGTVQLDEADYDGRTALHLSASCGRHQMCAFLLSLACYANAKDRYGHTPLYDAKAREHQDAAGVLLHHLASRHTGNCFPLARPHINIVDLVRRSRYGPGTIEDLYCAFEEVGILRDDPRVSSYVSTHGKNWHSGDRESVEKVLLADDLLARALQGRLVVPGWTFLSTVVARIHKELREEWGGKVADYIPALRKADANKWGVAVCSVEGQRLGVGDCQEKFSVQSCSKPITYAIALDKLGQSNVFEHVGREPSGRPFNEKVLDTRREPNGHAIPHNPLINAGAVMSCALVLGRKSVSECIDEVLGYWDRLAGNSGRKCTVDQETYEGEAETADCNFCLGHMLNEVGAFPSNVSMVDSLHLYFQCCSILQDCESMSVVAATLANGGVCPLTHERIFSAKAVRDTLSIMFTCGMYDYSGEFCFQMGFPAKSGVAGAVLIVIPNVCGICTWSPPLDGNGNSVRGIAFCERLSSVYKLHCFDSKQIDGDRTHYRKNLNYYHGDLVKLRSARMINAAATGDLKGIEYFYGLGGPTLLNHADYDGRTALHLACVEGQLSAVKMIVSLPGAAISPVDNWGSTPVAEALLRGHTEIVQILSSAESDSSSPRVVQDVVGLGKQHLSSKPLGCPCGETHSRNSLSFLPSTRRKRSGA